MDKSDFEQSVRCPKCGKLFFKLIEGYGKAEVFCKGCRKEVVVPFGREADERTSDKTTNINSNKT